jgi:ribonuclease P protein component
VLASQNRLRRSSDFAAAVRRGRRCGRSRLVVHWGVPDSQLAPRAGFVVSKAVGGAVVRNTVTRRLRALVRDRLEGLPAGTTLVVRALPPAGASSFAERGADLDACLAKLLPTALTVQAAQTAQTAQAAQL